MEEELEAPIVELFDTFDAEPLVGASIAQVHRARMASGREVVVKVQRPGIEGRVRRDMEGLLALAEILMRLVPQVRPFDPVGLVRELERSLRLELDFTEEARNIRRFLDVLADVQGLWIPDVVDDRSGRTVLTMEHSSGLRVDRYAAKHPERRGEVSRRAGELAVGVEAFLRESPGDVRRVLRRLADGTLGRLQAPRLEELLVRTSRAVERLTGGVIAASFIVGGALLTGLDGWHHRTGVILLWVGVALGLWVGIGALRPGRGS